MKQKFSTAWKSSSQPRKQRKYRANAPLHTKNKFVSVNLTKELRKVNATRNVPVRKEDKVKILRGKYKGKEGKVLKVWLKISKIEIEGITTKKQDGSQVNVKIQPSNLQIIELNSKDKKRMKKETTKKIEKKENSVDKKEKNSKKMENKENKK